jgi:hypothetical protein
MIGTSMKRLLLLLLAIVSLPLVARAQLPQLESTCQTVAKNFLLTDHLSIGIVQSFPELKPPGVRMTYSTRDGATKADMSDSFECEFDKAEPPYHLSKFCVSTLCYSPNEGDADRKRRFEEMRILLDRAEK